MKDAESWAADAARGFPPASEPPGKRPGMLIVRPAPGRPVRAVLLCDTVQGFPTHFDRFSRPCLGDPASCPGCAQGYRAFWHGYAPAICARSLAKVIVAISEGAWQHCPELQQLQGQLRGRVILLTRLKGTSRGPCRAELLPERWAHNLPPDFDPRPWLARMWGLHERARVLETPTAPRPLPPTDDDPMVAGL